MTEDELKQQLTAAQEQLAEMRSILSDTRTYLQGCPWASKPDEGLVAAALVDRCKQALSAAPKRGRVLWEGKGKIQVVGLSHEPWTKIELETGSLWGMPAKKIQFELLDIPMQGGQSVTVTVREEAE